MPLQEFRGCLVCAPSVSSQETEENGSTAEQFAAPGLPLTRRSTCANDLQRWTNEGSTGYRLFSPCRDAALLRGSVAAANAADRIAIKIDVIGPLGMRVLEMHSLLEENPGRYAVSVDYATTGLAGW